jgi:peptidyl-dipeptidase Dcp
MHKTSSLLLTAVVIAWLAAPSYADSAAQKNPFAEPSRLPLQAPPFDQIKDSDYPPAFDEGIRQSLAEIGEIANNRSPPTFANTIEAMEKSGRMLQRVSRVFNAVTGANTNETLEKIQADEAPKLAAYRDAVYLNPKLFARVRAIYQDRERLNLDPEALQLVTLYYQDFVHDGANLSDTDKAKLRELNKQISSLQTAFEQKLLAATKAGALLVDDRKALSGLSDAEIQQAAHAAEARGLAGKFVIPLQNTTQQPALASLADRATREKLFENSWMRSEKGDANDTRATIATLAFLRAQKAKLLGYPNYAAYTLYDQMAKTPEAVQTFIDRLIPAVSAKSEEEAKATKAAIATSGEHFDLQPWDWERYSGQVRKAQYALDDSATKPYFELDNVLHNGLFYAANALYGITFKERKDIPVYQADVRVFDVFDKDGSQLGMIYFDYFKRDNKSGGAWMGSLIPQSKLLGTKPVVYNVANFPKPAPGQPALLTFDQVTSMFHEFGHALHGLFANETYPTISGTQVARDFVEFPSQFNEHWALYPAVLKHYAVDYRTGKPMPDALIDEMRKAETFNQGYALAEVVAAAELDMQWHTLPADAQKKDVDTFEAEALKAGHVDFKFVPPRYRSSYFLHIWSNGYAAAYYAYLWTEMLDDDAFAWFTQHGGLTRENGQRFRDLILSRGHTEDYAKMFRDFYGKDPEIGPMLEHRGLQ